LDSCRKEKREGWREVGKKREGEKKTEWKRDNGRQQEERIVFRQRWQRKFSSYRNFARKL
jgi:hypothetical protein